MAYKILHKAEQEIFRLIDVKNFLRISHSYDDIWITDLINGSIEAAENFLRTNLLLATVQVWQDHINNSIINLPLTPVITIVNVTVKTALGEEKRIEEYKHQGSYLKIHALPRFELLNVEYIAGYADQKIIPPAIKQGILLHTAEMYDSHGVNASISDEVRKLYQPYRTMQI